MFGLECLMMSAIYRCWMHGEVFDGQMSMGNKGGDEERLERWMPWGVNLDLMQRSHAHIIERAEASLQEATGKSQMEV